MLIKYMKKRLKKRKYSKDKISDNLEVEIFRSCLFESKTNKHNVLVIDTSLGFNINKVLKYIRSI